MKMVGSAKPSIFHPEGGILWCHSWARGQPVGMTNAFSQPKTTFCPRAHEGAGFRLKTVLA